MDYNSFVIILILVIIGVTILSTLLFSAITVYSNLAYKSDDLLRYYIHNIYYSSFCAFTYVSFFVLFLYGLRLWNINKSLDLYALLKKIALISNFSGITCVIIAIYGLFLGINVILFLTYLHKYCQHHIYILYFYFRYNGARSFRFKMFFRKLAYPYMEDIISYTIKHFLFTVNNHLYKNSKNTWYSDGTRMPWYHVIYHVDRIFTEITCYKHYTKFIILSPILVIVYDCLFHNFVISNMYTYLLIYIPVMLWRRITICLFTDAHYICELLWNIYYKKETCIYAILPVYKELLNMYICSGLRHDAGDLDFAVEQSISADLSFILDSEEHNIYCNADGVFLKRTADNKLFRKIYDETSTEEWILLADKYHFVNNKSYKTLVFIN